MSRRFAGVGVHLTAERLQQLAAGALAAEAERIDVCFALAVSELQREPTLAKLNRARRRGAHWAFVAIMAVIAMLGLMGMAYLFFGLANGYNAVLFTPPF
jgi:hypothetical protein